MITERQAEILKIIIQEYTKTALPVGSKKIMELMPNKVSSATIRNDCVILENEGFLEKQHTSSGRVPSSKGYRYYVDNLMNDELDSKIFEKIESLFDDRSISINDVINESTKIISELTHLTAIISKKDIKDDLKVKRIELIPFSTTSASVIFILSNGEIINKVYYLNENEMNDLKISINLFNDNLIDTKISELLNKSEDVKEKLKDVVRDYDSLFQKFLNAMLEETNIKKQAFGINNMLTNPEFSDTERVRRVLSIVENISPFDWFDYNYQNSKNNICITTKIGNEVKSITGEDDLSVIGAEFTIGEGQINAITLIGPKRMKYDEASVLLQFLVDKINGFKK